MAVASLAAEAAAWRKHDFGGSGSALGSAAAAARRQRQRGVGGVGAGSVVYADDDCIGNDDNDD